jgi:hypothetical protein
MKPLTQHGKVASNNMLIPRKRALHVLGVCGIAFCSLAWPIFSQQSRQQKGPSSQDPKCSFLRQEAARVFRASQEFLNQSPLASVKTAEDLAARNASIADWAGFVSTTEAFEAHRKLLRLAVSACERHVALSDTVRLTDIDKTRAFHVRGTVERWHKLAGEAGKDQEATIAAQVSAVYEAESRSFYNASLDRFEDRDIGKDYPDLPDVTRASSLDESTKRFYESACRYLRYEEAGQLSNALKGLDQRGLNYAYMLRTTLTDRVNVAAARRDQVARDNEQKKRQELKEKMIQYALIVLAVLLVVGPLWVWSDRARAKYRAFRKGLKRSPFWFGNAEWIFWEPGETVVLLEHKRLVPMMNPEGGYRTISAWRGQEYKGRISYKTRFSTWKSDPILTSDGLSINLAVGIWWRIAEAGIYVSAIASDYHEGDRHWNGDLSEAAEVWIQKLAAGTLREEVNQLPAEQLISPYVQAYLKVRRGAEGELFGQGDALPNFSEQLGKAQFKLNGKTLRYGIEIERVEVQELMLPPVYQQKLEAVRVAFLEPSHARALTEAQVIALQGLASVIGPDKVGLIEVLKHVDLSNMNMNPFTGIVPIVQPMLDTVHRQTEKALPPSTPHGGLPPTPKTTPSKDGGA